MNSSPYLCELINDRLLFDSIQGCSQVLLALMVETSFDIFHLLTPSSPLLFASQSFIMPTK